MSQKLNILIVEPGKTPMPAIVAKSDSVFCDIVGGDFEVGVIPEISAGQIFCDANRKMGRTPNKVIFDLHQYIAGTFFICGLSDDGFCSLGKEQMEVCLRMFRRIWCANAS